MYKRIDVYPNGAPIPSVLPDSYQPASYGNAPAGQSCFTCNNFNLTTRYCSAWKAPVKPRWWCEGWAPTVKVSRSKIGPLLSKKITTNTVEEHFTNSSKSMLGYSLTADEVENEEDVITLNVPLMIRLLEYARESAMGDNDLHVVVERLIDLSEENEVLTMENYADIVQEYEYYLQRK